MKKQLIALVAAVAFTGAVDAKTVAWYRFEEAPSGTRTTGESEIVNSVDPAKHVGRAYVQTPILWSGAQQLLEPAELMPDYTNSFNRGFKVLDPLTETAHDNAGALHFNSANDAVAEAAGSTVLIADDPDFHLQSLTIEFFVRIPACEHPTDRYLIAQRSANNSLFTWDVLMRNGNLFGEIDDGVTRCSVCAAYDNVADGKWHHVALVVDGMNKKLSIYVDYYTSTWSYQKDFTGEICYDNAQPIALGPHVNCYYGIVEHDLDELRITDRVLTKDEMLRALPLADPSPAAETNTLVYLDFEGGAAVSTYSDFKSVVTVLPVLQNKAPYHPGFEMDAITHTGAGMVNAAPVRFVADHAFANTGSAGGDRFAPNLACVQTVTNSLENDWADAVALSPDITRDMLFGDDVTIEFSFRMPKPTKSIPFEEGINSMSSGSIQLANMLGGFQVLKGANDSFDYGYLQCYVGNTQLTGPWQDHPSLVPQNCADDAWHHCVLTYDRDLNRAEFFLDGVMRLSADNIEFPDVGSIWYLFRREFMLGDSYYDDRYLKNVKYDDVRITRGVLAPSQFLSESYPADVNGERTFMSLQEAIVAAGEGDTVNLRRNETIAGSDLVVMDKADLTIDLKGHVLHSSPASYVMDVEGSALTITDSVGGGCIAKDTQTTIVQVGKTAAATLTLAGGKILFAGENPIAEDPSSQASGSCVSVRNYGRLVMTGGELDDGGDVNEWAVRASDGGIAELAGGIVKGGVQPSTSAGAVRIMKESSTLFDENPLAAQDGKTVIHRKYHMEQVGGEGVYADYWHAVRNPPEGLLLLLR